MNVNHLVLILINVVICYTYFYKLVLFFYFMQQGDLRLLCGVETRELHIRYFSQEEVDDINPRGKKCGYFELCEGPVNGIDEHGHGSSNYTVISDSETFQELVLDIIKYLRNPLPLSQAHKYKYQYRTSERARAVIDDTGHGILAEILNLHNDVKEMIHQHDFLEMHFQNLLETPPLRLVPKEQPKRDYLSVDYAI